MLDEHLATLVIGGVATCVSSAAVILWRVGVEVGHVKSALDRYHHIEAKLDDIMALLIKVPVIEARLVQQENVVSKIMSDHKELRRSLGETREKLASFSTEE